MPSGIYGTLLVPIMLLTTTAKKKRLFVGFVPGIRIYSNGIAGFTEQWTAFVCTKGDLAKWRF